MDAYPIAERRRSQAPPQLGDINRLNQESLDARGKGLSIVDSARRDLEATLQLLADRAQYITGSSGAAIALRDGARVLCRASTGSAAPELGASLDLGTGLSGESVRSRMSLCCNDVATDSRVDRESCLRLGIASFAVVPIIRQGDVIGIFEIFSGKPRVFHERDIAALERLREMVNVALDVASCDRATASFAVHGSKVKALAAAAGAGAGQLSSGPIDARANTKSTGMVTALTDASNRPMQAGKASDRIKACKRCGFPVSEGRLLCLDCEDKGLPGNESVFLMAPGSSAGIKAWVVTNRYVIGMVVISAATIAFALLR